MALGLERDGYEAYAIDPTLRANRTSGFDAHCDPEPR